MKHTKKHWFFWKRFNFQFFAKKKRFRVNFLIKKSEEHKISLKMVTYKKLLPVTKFRVNCIPIMKRNKILYSIKIIFASFIVVSSHRQHWQSRDKASSPFTTYEHVNQFQFINIFVSVNICVTLLCVSISSVSLVFWGLEFCIQPPNLP